MSKASKWARKGRRAFRFRERLSPYERRLRLIPLFAVVGLHGDLLIKADANVDSRSDQRMKVKEAIRFARWILDTFGESDAH